MSLVLQLDHINGINTDNRIDNLRFLCPNCHTQTETYAGKKNKSYHCSMAEIKGNTQVWVNGIPQPVDGNGCMLPLAASKDIFYIIEYLFKEQVMIFWDDLLGVEKLTWTSLNEFN